MADSYPSVGLHVDLNEIVQANRAYGSTEQAIGRVGDAATETGKKIAAAADVAERASRDEMRIHAQAAKDRVANDQRANTERERLMGASIRMNQQAVRDEKAGVDSLLQLRMRFNQIVARENQKRVDGVTGSIRRMSEAEERYTQLSMRMNQQVSRDHDRSTQAWLRSVDLRIQAAARDMAQADRWAATWQRAENQVQRAAYAQSRLPGGTTRPELNNVREMIVAGARTGGGGGGGGPPGGPPINTITRDVLGLRAAFQAAQQGAAGFFSVLSGARNVLGNLRSLIFDVRTAVAVFLAGLVVTPIIHMVDAMTALNARVGLYAARASDVPYTFEAIYQTAQAARTPLEAIATLYTRLAPLAERLGKNQIDILRTTRTVAEAFQIGGATPAESTAASQQLAQALSSNRLGGDELRSLSENAPVLLSRIANSLHMNTGEFIKWAHEGHANAAVVVQAIDQAATEIDAMFRRMPMTIGQSITLVSNSLTHLVGEANNATGASIAVANAVAGFSRFLDQTSTLNALVGAINGTGAAFRFLGEAINTVVAMTPTIATFLALLVSARVIPPIWAAMRVQVLAFAAASAIAGPATAAMGVAVSGAAAAAGVALRGFSALTTMLGGPLGIAILAVAGLWNVFASAQNRATQISGEFNDAQQSSIGALGRAIDFSERYGLSTKGLNATLDSLLGLTRDGTKATDEASAAAYRRAAAERALTVSMLEHEAVAQLRIAREATSSVDGLGRRILRTATETQGRPELIARMDREDAMNRTIANRALMQSANMTMLAMGIATAPLTVTSPAPGSGHPENNGATAGHGAGAGAQNAIARMRAEVVGLNEDIAALNVNPLADLQARILAAGREAAAQRENGRASGLAGEASRLAMLKEEAQIRLELTRTLVQQQRQDRDAATASVVNMAITQRRGQVMRDFYGSANQSMASYAAALEREHQADLDGQRSQAMLSIAQQYNVRTIGEIADAYEHSTGVDHAKAVALQAVAQATYDARVQALELADAEQRLADATARASEVDAQVDQMFRYARALEGGTVALAAFNREQAIRDELAAHPKLGLAGATSVVDSLTVANERQRSAEMTNQVRLSSLTTRQREQEGRVVELINLQMAQMHVSAEDLTETERARLTVQAQITAELEAQAREVSDLKVSVEDSIRQAFIDTGRLDFTSLRQGVTQALRRALYDALLAKPINIIVNAVVDVATQGMQNAIQQIMNGFSGAGSFQDAAASWGGGGQVSSLGGQISSAISSLGSAGSTLANLAGSFAQMVPYALAAREFAIAGTQAIGNLIGLDDHAMRNAINMAQYTGILPGILAGLLSGPYDPSATTSIRVVNGRFQPQAVHGDDGGPVDEITQLSTQASQALQNAADVFGVNLAQFGNFYTSLGYTATDRHGYTAGYFGGDITGANAGTSSSRLRELLYASQGAEIAGVQSPEELVTRLIKEMLADAQASGALDLSDAEAALIAAATNLDDAANTIKGAREVTGSIRAALLKYTNPRKGALEELQASQLARRQQIQGYRAQGLLSDSQMIDLNASLGSLERFEISDVIARFADTLGGATHSLQDFVDAQKKVKDFADGLLGGALSPLSPEAKLQQVGNAFFSAITSARGGNYDAMTGLPDAAQTYLSQAQEFYGSTGAYAAIFQTVQDALQDVAGLDLMDPNTAAITQGMDDLQAAIEAAGLEIVTAINDNAAGGGGAGGTGTPTLPGGLTDAQQQAILDALAASAEAISAATGNGASIIGSTIGEAISLGRLVGGGLAF